MVMKTSSRGILEICKHEGVVPAPYLDSAGVWTWGVGHTKHAGGPDPEAMPRAFPVTERDLNDEIIRAVQQFAIDLERYEADVNQAVRVPLAQHQFDALVSFHYNTGGIHRAKLTKALNAGRSDASQHFMGWLKPPEIRKRRMAEQRLFETGDYAANGDQIPVWGTNGAGKLAKSIHWINGDWILEVMGAPPPEPKPIAVPAEVADVVADADKPFHRSNTIRTALGGLAASGFAFWNTADTGTRIAIGLVLLVLVFVFYDRIRKMNLGRLAKRVLG